MQGWHHKAKAQAVNLQAAGIHKLLLQRPRPVAAAMAAAAVAAASL